MITFTAPDGKDPVEYAAKVFYDLTHPDPSRVQRIANRLVQNINVRTNDGESYNGSSFAPYCPEVAKRKGFSEPNLRGDHDNDHMMDHVTAHVSVGADGVLIEIGIFSNDEKAKIARIQDQGSFWKIRNRGGVGTHNRRKKLVGVTPKGGRLTHKKVTTYTKHTVHGSELAYKPTYKYDFVKGTKFKSQAKGHRVVTDRVYVKRVKRTYTETRSDRYDHKTGAVVEQIERQGVMDVFERPRTYTAVSRVIQTLPHKRVRVRSTTPARPFLGLSAEDRDFVIRNILPKETV